MSALADKIRKAREQRLQTGKFTLVYRRPTDMEMLALSGQRSPKDFIPFLVGWQGVQELDLFPGGDPVDAAFDQDAAWEFLSDRPDLLADLVKAVLQSYTEYRTGQEDAKKN